MNTGSMELTSMSHAMQLHAQLIKANHVGAGSPAADTGLAKLITFSALSPSGNLPYARAVFDSFLHSHTRPSSYTTNTVIRAYSKSPNPEDALLVYLSLRSHGVADPAPPDNFTYPFLLASCTRLRAGRTGEQLHAVIHKLGLSADRYIENALIHMYCTCRRLDRAQKVFDRMLDRDVVSWTSLINGTVDADCPVEALRLFELMLDHGIGPSDATLVSVLRACADAGALSFGRRVHEVFIENQELSSKANVLTALIDMYAKCGCIDSAERLFQQASEKDVFMWTAMISGFASHGQSEEAFALFRQMRESNVAPDDRTITAVLCACRSAGWVAEGYRVYNNMHKLGVLPKIQHYGCMVDLLARAGHLKEAEEFIRRMPVEPDAVLWRTLIWAAKLHGDRERAERLMSQVQLHERDAAEAGDYVLMGNVYASAGEWEKKARLRELMARRRIGKLPGCSNIEVNGVVNQFEAGASGHPEAETIYRKLEEIEGRLRLEGYVPKLSHVLIDLEDEEKASQLQHHSERLAVAYGLISTSPEKKILVVKNLRSCEDCHTVMKLASKVYGREIVVRDRIKFHHFSNGSCSCKDFW